MINDIYDYLESGFKIFGLHGKANGVCGCGDVDCTAFYKHPIMSNWQNVPNWSDDQIECFDALGHFNTGFGVLCKGWLIIMLTLETVASCRLSSFVKMYQVF